MEPMRKLLGRNPLRGNAELAEGVLARLQWAFSSRIPRKRLDPGKTPPSLDR